MREVGNLHVPLQIETAPITPIAASINAAPLPDYNVKVIRPFEEQFLLKEGQGMVATAIIANTGAKPWTGAFIAPKFNSGVFMPI